ncbi:endonuclease domain-containing protein [Microbacterium sp. NPDC057944]|uniref:endonuclease domain-containing protein n=1 Tax=Microbacterium sp. NPDC057944 TaxID=3346286 RepID=UPI0036DBAFD7
MTPRPQSRSSRNPSTTPLRAATDTETDGCSEDVRSCIPARALRRHQPRFPHPDAESGLESLLRLRLHLLGIRLDCHVDIAGVGRVDFVVGRRLILEVDGRENHAGVDRRHRDLMRDAAASARGFETLRFDYAMVVHEWPSVVAAIEQALLRAAH